MNSTTPSLVAARPAFMVRPLPFGFGFAVERRNGSFFDAGLTRDAAMAVASNLNRAGEVEPLVTTLKQCACRVC